MKMVKMTDCLFRLETTLNYGLERVWCIQAQRGSNTVAIGYDEGSVTLKLGREEPAVSFPFVFRPY